MKTISIQPVNNLLNAIYKHFDPKGDGAVATMPAIISEEVINILWEFDRIKGDKD
tara:strand:+ start:343 stop:507 length:165 start_codon:yes stop_codon:yes gene_type:complete